MKKISRAAITLALAAATGSFALVSVAHAQDDEPKKEKKEKKEKKKKGEEAQGPVFKLGNEFRANLIKAQAAFEVKPSPDLATAEAQIAVLQPLVTNDDEKFIFDGLRLKLIASRQPIDDRKLAEVLDSMLPNPSTPKSEVGRLSYFRANIAYNDKQWPQALQLYSQAKTLGSDAKDLDLQLAKTKINAGDIKGGVADMEATIAKEKAEGKNVEELYKYAIASLQKTDDSAAVQKWTREWLHAYGTPKNWRTAIYVFGFQGKSGMRITDKQRLDLFRLMRASKSLAGSADYLEYAELCNKYFLSSETITVVKEGQATGAIPAGNSQAKELINLANQKLAAEGSLASQQKRAQTAADGKFANGVGDFALGIGDYTAAAEMYRLALTKGAVDADEVNTRLAIALASSGDKEGAKATLALVKNAPRSEIATLWTTWLDAPVATATTVAPTAG